jgi:hypothetical protein
MFCFPKASSCDGSLIVRTYDSVAREKILPSVVLHLMQKPTDRDPSALNPDFVADD